MLIDFQTLFLVLGSYRLKTNCTVGGTNMILRFERTGGKGRWEDDNNSQQLFPDSKYRGRREQTRRLTR